MGREAISVARWQGAQEEVKALLESQEIILRGAIRARIPRSGISEVMAEGDVLILRCHGETLELQLGKSEAAKWRDALMRPPPSLSEKLGVGPGKPAYVIGKCDDAELSGALSGVICATPADASVLIAMLASEADLQAAFAVAVGQPRLALWCVHPKGGGAPIGDGAIRAFMRANGYRDSKCCAVSARLTATRYGRRA